jgi:hypothetical protein
MMMNRDYCRSCRKTYAAVLELGASNNIGVVFIAGLPLYYLVAMAASYKSTSVAATLAGGSYTFIGVLSFAWLWCMICLFRRLANGITVSIFLLKAMGYWSFVSFAILLFYGISRLPLEYTTYLFVMLMPEVVLLLFSADMLRAARTRMFKEMATLPTASAHTASAHTASVKSAIDAVPITNESL